MLHDNAPAHKALSVCQFLTPQNMLQPFIPPPYSTDISPSEYFLFPKLKLKLKGLQFADVDRIQDELNNVQEEEFSAAFQKMHDRAKACIHDNGAYFV